MKRLSGILLVAIFICLFSGPAFARDEVLISGQIDHGGFGGPSLKVARIKEEVGYFMGGYGGWFINHTLMIGGGGYGLVNNVKAPESGPNGEALYYNMGYGGLILEYVNNSHNLFHFMINTLIGAGDLGYRRADGSVNWDYAHDTFFIVEPSINLEINVTHFFRVGMGLGYCYIDGLQLAGITQQDLTGVSGNLYLKFGSF